MEFVAEGRFHEICERRVRLRLQRNHVAAVAKGRGRRHRIEFGSHRVKPLRQLALFLKELIEPRLGGRNHFITPLDGPALCILDERRNFTLSRLDHPTRLGIGILDRSE